MVKHVLYSFGDLVPFLSNDDLSGANVKEIQEIISDQPTSRKLKMEMAITIDGMEPFVKPDISWREMGLLRYMLMNALVHCFQPYPTRHFPNVTSVARQLANANPSHENQLVTYADSCILPAYSYFREKFDHDLKPCLEVFRAACLFSPAKFNEIKPTVREIDESINFPHFWMPVQLSG